MTNSANADSPPSTSEIAQMLRGAIGQIRFAREYTLELLAATPPQRWFEIPPGLHTNVAWQVGHLTVSQYGLLMFRIRGRQPDDLELIPGKFRKAYSRQSSPGASPEGQPTADELMQRMATVYRLAMSELGSVDPETLSGAIGMPYAVYPTKLGAVLFCPLHEMIHAGQIGAIRRGLGLQPIR